MRTAAGNSQFDIGIVGGGPAGLRAAIWSARYLHSVVLVDSGDPRNWETRRINGLLGFEGIRPPDLRANGRDLCRKLGVDLVDAIVLHVEQLGDDDFALCLDEFCFVDIHCRVISWFIAKPTVPDRAPHKSH